MQAVNDASTKVAKVIDMLNAYKADRDINILIANSVHLLEQAMDSLTEAM